MATLLLISSLSELAKSSLVHWKNSGHRSVSGEQPSILIWIGEEQTYFGRSLGDGVFLERDDRAGEDSSWVALRHCSISTSLEGIVIRNCSASQVSIGLSMLDPLYCSLLPGSSISLPRRFALNIARGWVYDCRVLNCDDQSILRQRYSLRGPHRSPSGLLKRQRDRPEAINEVTPVKSHSSEVILHRTAKCKVTLVASRPSWVVEKRCIDTSARDAWIREIDFLKALRHDNLVSLQDWDLGDLPWFTMDYVGRDPGCFFDEQRMCTLDVDEQMLVQVGLTSALTYLHKKAIVHRYIKPANILISRNGKPVLADFGLSCRVEDCDSRSNFGTPGYLPPEAALGEVRDFSADVWVLGVVLLFVFRIMPLPLHTWLLKEDAEQNKYAMHWKWIGKVMGFKKMLSKDSVIWAMLEAESRDRASAFVLLKPAKV